MDNNLNKTPIVALYLRVSTSQQDHDMQRGDLLKVVEKMGATVYHEYTDTITGSTSVAERKYASDVIEDARDGKFNILLVWRLDRIARDEEFGLNYLRRIEETGCRVRFLTQPFINTPEPYTLEAASMVKNSRVMLFMGARMEHENIKARTRAAKTRDIKANKWPSNGHVPDGYMLDKATGGLLINPARAPIVQRIFSLYIDDGLKVRQIRDLLNKEEIPSYKGRPWGKDTIQDKLHNPVYIGKLPINGKKLGPIHTFTCEPIISDERFQEAQDKIKNRIERSKRNPKRELIFRPYVWCSRCGHDLHSITSGANTEYENYHYGFRRPPNSAKYKKRCPDGCGRISERKLVDVVFDRIGSFFKTDLYLPSRGINEEDVIRWMEENSGMVGDLEKRQGELGYLQAQLATLREQPERILDLYESGMIDKKALEKRLAKTKPLLKVLEEKIRFIKQGLVGEEEKRKSTEHVCLWLEDIRKQLNMGQVALFTASDMEPEYLKRREVVKGLLKFIKRIDIDTQNRIIDIQTKVPKLLNGKTTYEPEPEVKKGRPFNTKNNKDGNGGGNTGGNTVEYRLSERTKVR